MSRFPWMLLIVLGGALAITPVTPGLANFPTLGISAPQTAVDPAFPDFIGTAVLQAASAQAGLPLDQLTLTQAKPKVWSDGCLGLAPPDQMCAAVLVKGWEVTIAHQQQEWVYRTSASGRRVMLDPAGSHLSGLVMPIAEQIPTDQLPPKLDRSVVFREIKSGGFAGITQETRLYKDGKLVQQPDSKVPKATSSEQMRTLPKIKVRAFEKVLEACRFGQFDGLRYPPSLGAADYFTITLGNRRTTVQFTDINSHRLPADLQKVLQAWRLLLSSQ